MWTDSSRAARFPYWITLPSTQNLAEGRRWHFFFAWLFVINGFIYLIYGFARRHFQRDIAPTGADLRSIGRTILDHLTFKRARGEEAKRYNVLQKLTYIVVIFVLLPLMILTGLSMSPGVEFRRRPGCRSCSADANRRAPSTSSPASLIVLFVIVHILEVFIAGFFNEMRSMITGWFAVRPETGADDAKGKQAMTRNGSLTRRTRAHRHSLGARKRPSALRLRSDHADPWRRSPCSKARRILSQHGQRAVLRDGRAARARVLSAPRFRATSRPTARRVRRARTMPQMAMDRVQPTTGSRSTAWSPGRSSSRSSKSAACRRARRSRVTIASKAGARSANGRAFRSRTLLQMAGVGNGTRYLVFHCADDLAGAGALLREHRSHRCVSIRRPSWPTP